MCTGEQLRESGPWGEAAAASGPLDGTEQGAGPRMGGWRGSPVLSLVPIHLLQVMFSEEALPKGKGEYILGYYSNASSSIVGVTEPFQVSNASR